MKNILYIGNQLSESGKTDTTIKTLSEALRQEGFTVYAVSDIKNKVFRLAHMLLAIIKYAKKVDCVLIDTYSTSNFYFAYLSSQLCRLFNLKYIPILHGGNLPKRLKNSSKLSKFIFKNAYINVAPSAFIQHEFEKYGFSNLVYIPNSIHLKNYPFKQRNHNNINLLWVRSFSEIYNPLLAMDILKQLLDEGIKTTLCMVGPDNDGSLLKAKDYAKALQVEVIFTGKLSKDAWIELSQNYNMFINTTNFDNMPVSVIEAMALGLPIVSTNVGGMPFLVEHNHEGILVEPNNADEFVEAIKKVFYNQEIARNLTLNARKKVEHYDWELVKKQWLSLLQ
ncbi:glycosyltransferase family 4 protein [Mariniflexile aquimaris]|uniref:Glycosyltransferase family 4 protein n=1 Tax=Mariniflexile aquimaris TaxID=881009 RepID=A0ABW3BS09_9FLAO